MSEIVENVQNWKCWLCTTISASNSYRVKICLKKQDTFMEYISLLEERVPDATWNNNSKSTVKTL